MVLFDTLIDEYKRRRDYNIKRVFEVLKVAFIRYYGEENIAKVNRVIDDLCICYIGNNRSSEKLFNKIARDSEWINDIISLLVVKEGKELTAEDLIEYALGDKFQFTSKDPVVKDKILDYIYSIYLYRRKINDTDLSVVLDTSSGSLSEVFTLLGRGLDNMVDGLSCPCSDSLNLMYLRIKRGKISLHTLIHEINHLLQKEDMALREEGDVISIFGVSNGHQDLVNEVINEYVSKDIFDMFMALYDGDLTMFDTSFDSIYLNIDCMCNNIGLDIYYLLKDEIRSNLINGSAPKIEKIINSSNYNNLCSIFKEIYKEMIEMLGRSKGFKYSDYFSSLTADRKVFLKNEMDKLFRGVLESYFEYNIYEQRLSDYIDSLVSNGQAHRLK